MLECLEHGQVITDLHFKHQGFITAYRLVVSADGNTAECLCPVCLTLMYSYLGTGKKRGTHYRISTPEERDNPDVELCGLEDAAYPYAEPLPSHVIVPDLADLGLPTKVSMTVPASSKPLVRYRLVRGENGKFGRIETYTDDVFADPLSGVPHIPTEGEKVADPDRYKIPGIGSANGSIYGEAMKAYMVQAALDMPEVPAATADIRAEDLI